MAETKTVLVVDDEPDCIAIVEAILEDLENVSLISENNGAAALQAAAEKKPDLMILDVQMPEKNGFDVFAELRRNDATAGIPVIMLTGVAEKTGLPFSAEEMKDFLGSEPTAYFEKPVDPATLQSTVSEVLGL